MSSAKYRMSFSTGGLFVAQSALLAELYLDLADWGQVRTRAIEENLLQTRTVSSANRISWEICHRLGELDGQELELLIGSDHSEQASLLWLAVCRRHAFIAEFAVEVILEHVLTYHYDLSYDDFDIFFNAKMEWHQELENIKQSTRNKLRQVCFRMMREAQILGDNNTIIPAMLSPRLLQILCHHRDDLRFFPAMENTLQECQS